MIAGRDSCYRDELASLTPSLRAFARALVDGHHTEIADELVQDALVSALSETQEIRGVRLRLSLLARVVAAHRRSLRNAKVDQHAGTQGKLAQHGAVPGSHWPRARRGMSRDAHRLDEMPHECREAFLLVTLESLTYVQTAECLGTTLNTVIQNLARARDHLSQAKPKVSPKADGVAPRSVPYLRLVK